MMPYSHIQFWERNVIKKMLDSDKSYREIAAFLGRSPSTISRELSRNSDKYWYRPSDAQQHYLSRRNESKCSKLDSLPELQKHVINYLKDKRSPDAIAGRLKLENSPYLISHETIYSWIYKQASQGLNYYKYLARSARRRQKRQNKRKSRVLIPHRISIHSRPNHIDNKKTIGHWEGDTIIGKGQKGAIATLVERKSLFLAAGLMENRKPITCNRAILEAYGEISNKRIKTITFDNGTEFYEHNNLQEALECRNYFADPYSAWQRGANEHVNGMLRRYFPKGSSFQELTQNDVDEAVNKLNNTPRRSLGYKTPYEVFYNLPVAPQT